MKSNRLFLAIILGLAIFGLAVGTAYYYWQFQGNRSTLEIVDQVTPVPTKEKKSVPEGMMVLIEYKDLVGLSNFVNELYQRQIPSVLLATPEFVEENCQAIKKMTNLGMEIIGSHTEAPFWDIPYEEQYQRISEIKEGIENCTGKPLKIVGSRFFASDENTIKAAQELGIPYITARGTTGTRATIYEPEDYEVKVLSISNIETVAFKYGSLCDYSYWTRGGQPSDMKKDLVDAVTRYDKVTPVSHTNIGGYLEDWINMWKDFWDNYQVDWKSLDELMAESDYQMPFYKIPQNRNAPYTPQMLEHVEDSDHTQGNAVDNPCAVEDLPEVNQNLIDSKETNSEIIMFHNNTGPMCLEAKEFFEENNIEIKEVLNTDDDYSSSLAKYKNKFPSSEGVSENYGYYPFIFTESNSYSGFNDEIEAMLLEEIK